jgi:hypothetical protein
MANSSPFPDLIVHWYMSSPVPQLLLGDDFQPSDLEEFSETSIYECLKPLGDGLCYPQGFLAVKYD